MKRPHISVLIALVLVMTACEQPNSPDFKVAQQVQAPLLSETTYRFLGSKNALIDSTSSDFESLFSTKSSGLVNLSKQQDFDFGNLDDVIPEIDVPSKSVATRVGEIALNDFSSSSGNLGTASFQTVTGEDPNFFPQGTPIPGGSSTVYIDIDTDYLESAVVKGDNGIVTIAITNDLGLTIDQMDISLTSDNRSIPYDTDQLPAGANFVDDETRVFELGFSDGDVIQNLKAEVDVSWNTQQTSDDPNSLIVNELQSENLVASQVSAAVESQNFNAHDVVAIDDTDFQFTKADHFVEISSGMLAVNQITNSIDLAIDPLIISFPGIRRAPYNPEDSLVIRFEGNSRIPRSQSPNNPPSKSVDLQDLRIYANGNQLEYNIQGTTEDTQEGGYSIRTISENDEMSATVTIEDLEIGKAYGLVAPRSVIVNNDDPANGFDVIDLFRKSESEVITIDALSDFSDQLDGIELTDPTLSINYNTDIGVPATIYAAILGIDASGEQAFLKGLDQPGNPHRVAAEEVPQVLYANGTSLTADQLIKFTIDPSSGGAITNAIQFTSAQTNVDEFLNNLPSEIRFVSIARVNESQQEGTVTNEIVFEPSMSVDIPLNFSATNATFTDTVEADLSSLPNPEEDDQRLTDAKLYVGYTNALPLAVSVNLVMLDQDGNVITEVSSDQNSDMNIAAAPVGQDGFVSDSNSGNMTISLNQDQLTRINETDNLQFRLGLNTSDNSAVKVRSGDTISLKISLSASLESTIN